MTFDDDFVQLEFAGGNRRISCKSLGVEWPPPEKLDVLGFPFKRDSYSLIPDALRESCGAVVRGARYVPAEGEG
jgi:hypothetical protein